MKRYTSFRREPTLGYEAVAGNRVRSGVGLRVQNLSTGESFDVFESGRHTLRARAQASYRLSPKWSLGAELTQDLLNKGDSTTFTLGASRDIPLQGQHSLSVGGGLTWATGEHWRSPYRDQTSPPIQAQELKAGFGSFGAGLSYRKRLADNLVWTTNVGIGQSIGQLQKLNGSRIAASMQTGLTWFGQR